MKYTELCVIPWDSHRFDNLKLVSFLLDCTSFVFVPDRLSGIRTPLGLFQPKAQSTVGGSKNTQSQPNREQEALESPLLIQQQHMLLDRLSCLLSCSWQQSWEPPVACAGHHHCWKLVELQRARPNDEAEKAGGGELPLCMWQ